MGNYIVKIGDTIEDIAKKVYGDISKASLLLGANPAIIDGFLPIGKPLVTPKEDIPYKAANKENITLYIDGKAFDTWSGINLSLEFDGIDQVSFSAPFDYDNKEHREIFKPFSYKECEVYISGERLFAGVIMNASPSCDPNKSTVSVVCYSKAGVLNDCQAPTSIYPLEFKKTYLVNILNKVCEPFGVPVVLESDQGAVFEQVQLAAEKKVWSFFSDLAKNRNCIISTNKDGGISIVKEVKAGNPVAYLVEESLPMIGIEPGINSQDYFSTITGIEPTRKGKKGAKITLSNPHLYGVLRPYVFKVSDTKGGTVQTAVNAKAGRMFANVVSYAVTVASMKDSNGNYWQPNTTILIKAPSAMIYEQYEFFIHKVNIIEDENRTIAVLTVTLPGAFSGKIPERMPWD